MSKQVIYTCDTCECNIKRNSYSVETTEVNKPSVDFVDAVYWFPQPKPTFCSMGCLAKSLEFWLEKYKKDNETSRENEV